MRSVGLALISSALLAPATTANAGEDFTIVVIGDTQKQVEIREDLKDSVDASTIDPTDPSLYRYPAAHAGFEAMINWLIDPGQTEPIELVIQVGDAIEDGGQANTTSVSTAEWKIFNHYWEQVKTRYGEIQTLVTRGNHDNPDEFVQHFGDISVPGGDLRAVSVTLGGLPVLVLIGLPCNPTDAQITWVKARLADDPGRMAILASHIITDPSGGHRKSPPGLPYGQSFAGTCPGVRPAGSDNFEDPNNPPTNVWDELVAPHSGQIFLVVSGHFTRLCTEFVAGTQDCTRLGWTRREGFKAIRIVRGLPVIDAFQNWQWIHRNRPSDPGQGALTLVRFHAPFDPNLPGTVEIKTWDAVRNEFDDRPGITSLPLQTFRITNDRDADGVLNSADLCPAYPDGPMGQIDTDGDGIGDACQCGDLSDDGRVNILDRVILSRFLAGMSDAADAPVEKCSVVDRDPGPTCDVSDVAVLRQALAFLDPGIAPLCTAATSRLTIPPPGAILQAFALYHSVADDGVAPASLPEIPVGSTATLNLYIDSGSILSIPGTVCSGSGWGDENCSWVLRLQTTPGVTIDSYALPGLVVNDESPTELRIVGGDPFNGEVGVRRIGSVTVSSLVKGRIELTGGQLALASLRCSALEPARLALACTSAPGDADGDGVRDGCDSCPAIANADQADADRDGVADACDNCPLIPNPITRDAQGNFVPQPDFDGDGIGDACESYVVVSHSGTPKGFGGLRVENGDLLDTVEPSLILAEAAVFTSGEKIDAVHVDPDGIIVFSTAGPATLVDGPSFGKGDLVEWDGQSGVVIFDGEQRFGRTKQIDAVWRGPDGKLVLSVANAGTTDLGKSLTCSGGADAGAYCETDADCQGSCTGPLVTFRFRDGDLVEYDPATDRSRLVLSEDAFARNEDIDGVHLRCGRIVLTTTGSSAEATLGGLTFQGSDVIEYDPATQQATLRIEGQDLFTAPPPNTTPKTVNIDAISLDPAACGGP
ncbi:MAG: thrombospondin type 3 repeat-containing protein [Myxococcota bacterium]